MLKDESWEKKNGLAEQRALTRTQGKKRVYHIWKKGQAAQEDYRDILMLHGEKIRRAKSHIEFILHTALKGIKNVSMNKSA